MPDFIPRRDLDLRSYAVAYHANLAADPAAYGLAASDAAELAASLGLYQSSLALAHDPSTRTRPHLVAKDEARRELVKVLRSLSRRIRACPTITVAQLANLRLPIGTGTATHIGSPSTRPMVHILGLRYGSHVCLIYDEATPTRRAKPRGVQGAQIFVYIGDNPPGDLNQWELRGMTTRADFEVFYRPQDAGKMAHIVVRWYSPRAQTGPRSPIVSGRIAA